MAEPDDTIVANLWPVYCALSHGPVLDEIINGPPSLLNSPLLALYTKNLAASLSGAHAKVKTRCQRIHEAVQPLLSGRNLSRTVVSKALAAVKKHNAVLYDFWQDVVRYEPPKVASKADFSHWVAGLSPSEKIVLVARFQGDNMDP